MKQFIPLFITFTAIAITSCSSEISNTSENQGDINEVIIENEIFFNGTSVILNNEKNIESYLNDFKDELNDKTLTLITDEAEYILNYSDFDVSFDKESIIKKIDDGTKNIDIKLSYNKTKVIETLETINEQLKTEPINATYYRDTLEDGTVGFIYNDGTEGRMVDIDTLIADIEEAAKQEYSSIDIPFTPVAQEYTTDILKDSSDLLGSYYTSYASSSYDRNQNLEISCEKINNSTIYPEEIFSTSGTLGPRTIENGFKVSKVIVNQQLVDGVGGGICQISSTLYNSVLESELEVVERLNHSLKVGYAPYARDATMAWELIDFKFKNSTEYPLLIESYMDTENKHVVVNIYGNEYRPENRTIEFFNQYQSTWAPNADKIIEDNTKTVDYSSYTVKPKNGVKYNLYKNIYIDGELSETVYINSSSYKAVQGEKVVGTLPLPVVEEPIIDEPIIDEPIIDEPVIDEPVIDEPIIDEPVIDEPVVDEPITDNSNDLESTNSSETTDAPVFVEPVDDGFMNN